MARRRKAITPEQQEKLDEKIHKRRKLTWLSRGTKHQPARGPIRADLADEEVALAVEHGVAAQFREARDKTRLKLDLRPTFRRLGKEAASRLVAAIRSVAPKKRPDGKPVGGSLASEFKKAGATAVKRWGFALKAGSEGGLRVAVRGLKGIDKRVQQVALERLRATTSAKKLERRLLELKARAQELERATRRARLEAARARS